MQNRRCKVLRLSDDLVIRCILGWSKDRLVPRYRVEGLPDGWQVERVAHDFHSACVEALISHEDFDEVPAGQEFPLLSGVTVCLVTEWPAVALDKVSFRELT